MKTLFKLAFAVALTAGLLKWWRQSVNESRAPTVGPTADWEPDAAAPLRGENLSVEPPVTH
jgi:hypothetical protein